MHGFKISKNEEKVEALSFFAHKETKKKWQLKGFP